MVRAPIFSPIILWVLNDACLLYVLGLAVGMLVLLEKAQQLFLLMVHLTGSVLILCQKVWQNHIVFY